MTLPLLLTEEELYALTGYVQFTAQMRWLHLQFGITPPRRADGFPVLSRSQLEHSLHKKCGMAPPNLAGVKPAGSGWEPNWGKFADK